MDMFRSLPRVGVDAALCEVTEEMEEELSARARGAKGGGLPGTGGLKGRVWRQHTYCESAVNKRETDAESITNCFVLHQKKHVMSEERKT